MSGDFPARRADRLKYALERPSRMPRKVRRAKARRTTRLRRSPTTTVSALAPRPRIALREPPHAHAVCRQCGRISEVEVGAFDGEQWTSFAAAGTPDWSIEGISLSVTGYCPRCRHGPGTG